MQNKWPECAICWLAYLNLGMPGLLEGHDAVRGFVYGDSALPASERLAEFYFQAYADSGQEIERADPIGFAEDYAQVFEGVLDEVLADVDLLTTLQQFSEIERTVQRFKGRESCVYHYASRRL